MSNMFDDGGNVYVSQYFVYDFLMFVFHVLTGKVQLGNHSFIMISGDGAINSFTSG